VIVRTWNLFHGNTVPPGRRAHLRQMVELITADRPDIVLLQEIPGWALPHIGAWANMQCSWARAKRPKLGLFPIPATVGRGLTAPHHGVVRSGFAGQGNAILFPSEATRREEKTITLNTNVFTEEHGKLFGLTPKQMVAWERERRVCQLVRYELPNRLRFLVANKVVMVLPSIFPSLTGIDVPSGPTVDPVSFAPSALKLNVTSTSPPGAAAVPFHVPSTSAAYALTHVRNSTSMLVKHFIQNSFAIEDGTRSLPKLYLM